jgi:hypothetical protein
MKRIFFFTFLVLAFFSSCSNETPVSEVDETIESNDGLEEGWMDLTIQDGGYKLEIEIPGEEITRGKSESSYHEETGELEVKAGPNFDLFILEDESQIEMVKNELNNHPFYNVMYAVATDSSLMYQQITEGGGKEQWHIYVERDLGNSTLLIRSNEEIPFTEFQAKLMLKSALSISPL